MIRTQSIVSVSDAAKDAIKAAASASRGRSSTKRQTSDESDTIKMRSPLRNASLRNNVVNRWV